MELSGMARLAQMSVGNQTLVVFFHGQDLAVMADDHEASAPIVSCEIKLNLFSCFANV
jgi:hypothetical protein